MADEDPPVRKYYPFAVQILPYHAKQDRFCFVFCLH